MQTQKSQRWIPALSALCLGGSSVAGAAPGDHIGNEKVEFAPSIGLWGAWRSNVYLQEGEIGGGDPTVSGAFLELRPGATLKVKSQDVKFGLDFAYTPRLYLDSALSNLNRFTFYNVGAKLNLFPNSKVGLNLSDRLSLSGRETEAESADWAYLTVLTNGAEAALAIRPGSSMEVTVGGTVDFTDYKTDAGTNPLVSTGTGSLGLAALNRRLAYGPKATLSWKFLPKTAVLASYSQSWFFWNNNFLYAQGDGLNPSEANNFDAYLGVPDGTDLRLSTGLRGRFTDKLVLGFQLAYVRMMYDEQSVIADAEDGPAGIDISNDANADTQGFGADLTAGLGAEVELGYDISEDNRLTLGYRRDFADIYFSNYLAYHQYSVGYSGLIADRLSPELSASLRQETYTGEISRRDNFIRLRGDLTYAITKYLDVGGGAWWTQRASVDTPDDNALDDANPAIEYDDINVHLGVTFTY